LKGKFDLRMISIACAYAARLGFSADMVGEFGPVAQRIAGVPGALYRDEKGMPELGFADAFDRR
jgi:hypothetical protein